MLPLKTRLGETETGLSVLEDCPSGSPYVSPSGSSKTKQKNRARTRKRRGIPRPSCLLSTDRFVFNSHFLAKAIDSNPKTQNIDGKEPDDSFERSLDFAHLVCSGNPSFVTSLC